MQRGEYQQVFFLIISFFQKFEFASFSMFNQPDQTFSLFHSNEFFMYVKHEKWKKEKRYQRNNLLFSKCTAH